MVSLEILMVIKRAKVAKETLPKTIINGLAERNFPKSPANPKRNTAI